ncbi:hydrogenase maturation protein [Spirilliplanes yamanashiensis]|uniref:Formyl transferase n=1 Tax=Spirilliplanes yamanashiensis TaxID=42233 RepID=A0A8J3YAM9_9ACTN|nr:enoyl-CoA hydratase-related protein [Spirilliplanes yamanashiensis]MDP9816025.1 putative two-component system hydrogenase maturation factor HypX/HoxX [Spirilliplanes yamanashiensis]GIJ04285.1 formyl transferase [Spirilliplanes yamanashiensis]
MRILLLVSAFNGLTQRVWCHLRDSGHQVGVLLATDERGIAEGVRAADPELIICPYLTHRVPAEVWQRHRTIILHPGPVGDRGPSSLDWAISEGLPQWGVTALQAAEELDAGPVWATRTFPMPAAPPRKSALYGGPVADAALECVTEVVAKAADPAFRPTPLERMRTAVLGARLRPAMKQTDRMFDWSDDTDRIVRRVRAADGAPGVRTEVAGLPVFAYDAHPGAVHGARPGAVLARRQGAVLVGTGDGSVWLGHLRDAADGGVKLPATTLLGRRLAGVPNLTLPPGAEPEVPSYRQIRYRRSGAVGWLAFDFYNGAMSTAHCRRLLTALRHAAAQDTRVLVLRGGTDAFGNGIHLNAIDAAPDPAAAGWENIRAINEVCRELITCRQVLIAGYAGNAGAGGVMLGLGADVVAARDGIVLNPYYDMGLSGSELHTYTLPQRVGAERAARLLSRRLPLGVQGARSIGLVDEVGPRHPDAYAAWLADLADRWTDPPRAKRQRLAKQRRLAGERLPLDVYEQRELAEMSRDLFDDRQGFAAARQAFVHKTRATTTPAKLAFAAPVAVGNTRHVARPRQAPGAEVPHLVRPAVPA